MQGIEQDTKDAFMQSGVLTTYLTLTGLSIYAGITSFLETKEPFGWRRFLAHLTSSSFAGMMTGFACQYVNIGGPLQFVIVGAAAHMGTPAVIKLALKLRVVRRFLEDTDKKAE